jgi:hypothetical protein
LTKSVENNERNVDKNNVDPGFGYVVPGAHLEAEQSRELVVEGPLEHEVVGARAELVQTARDVGLRQLKLNSWIGLGRNL